MNNSFIFFGCWNNINCEKEAIYRDIVLNCIKEFEPAINKMFIAGDNWYNTLIKNEGVKDEKELSYKYYLVDTLVSGYHILYSINKDIYICVGNHDEASSNTNSPNCMINTQKYYIKKLKKYIDKKTQHFKKVMDSSQEPMNSLQGVEGHYTDIMIRELLDSALPSIEKLEQADNDSDNCIKLYADTNIGVYEDAFSSYIVIIINTNILTPIYLEAVRNKIVSTIEKTRNQNKRIFVMGHIPLFYDKHKKSKEPKEPKEPKETKEKFAEKATETSVSPKKEKKPKEKGEDITKLKKGTFVFNDSGNSVELIDSLYDILAEHNCIYLCADCHNFNIMTIKKNDKCVIQITSGTGGADPDIITDLKDKKGIVISQYHIDYYSINSYGYCKVVVEEGGGIIVYYNKIIAADNGNKSIDELYVYGVKNNMIEYLNKEKIKGIIISNATKNRHYYCDRVAKYKTFEGKENNVIKSEKEKGVCYRKEGKS
jgi:hypothetical protein